MHTTHSSQRVWDKTRAPSAGTSVFTHRPSTGPHRNPQTDSTETKTQAFSLGLHKTHIQRMDRKMKKRQKRCMGIQKKIYTVYTKKMEAKKQTEDAIKIEKDARKLKDS